MGREREYFILFQKSKQNFKRQKAEHLLGTERDTYLQQRLGWLSLGHIERQEVFIG